MCACWGRIQSDGMRARLLIHACETTVTPAHDEPLEGQAARAQTNQAMRETAHSFRKSTAQRRPRSLKKIRIPWFFFRQQNGVILNSDVLQPDNLSSLVADSSVEDSDHASAASTVPLLVTLLSLIRGLRPELPHRRRKGRSCKSSWPVPQLPTIDTDSGKHRRESRRHSPRCTRALMRALGRSRWLNGLCRGLHRGCTDGTGPRPSVEP